MIIFPIDLAVVVSGVSVFYQYFDRDIYCLAGLPIDAIDLRGAVHHVREAAMQIRRESTASALTILALVRLLTCSVRRTLMPAAQIFYSFLWVRVKVRPGLSEIVRKLACR